MNDTTKKSQRPDEDLPAEKERADQPVMDDTDDALADSFPASDPPSQSVPTTPSSPARD